jgi:uncharacterized DUF497 family protein
LQPAPEVHFLEWDDENETHILEEHGITVTEVNQVLGNRHVLAENPKGGPDRIFIIGQTNSDRLITISLEKTWDPTAWRPVTAFPSGKAERSIFSKHLN